jgi:tetratricopeptide (TPR) repeat protein
MSSSSNSWQQKSKEYRISNIAAIENLMKWGNIKDVWDVEVQIITMNYDYLTKYSLKKVKTDTIPGHRYESDGLDYNDKVWLVPTIVEARESGHNLIADFLDEKLKALDEYHSFVEKSKSRLKKIDDLMQNSKALKQSAEYLEKQGRYDEAIKMVHEATNAAKEAVNLMQEY